MAAPTDHVRRDAEHAARQRVSTILGKFSRRMNEANKAHIAKAIEDLPDGVVIDFDTGTKLGEKAADAAVQTFLFDNPAAVTPEPRSLGS